MQNNSQNDICVSFSTPPPPADKSSSGSVVKQGPMEQREGGRARWTPCHVELTPCELRLYVLDSSANRQLTTAYSLSHCQGVVSPAPCGPPGQSGQQLADPRTLQALFFNSTRLQLRAASQREAGEWRRAVWEKVQVARPAAPRQQAAAAAFASSPSGLNTQPDGQSNGPSPEEALADPVSRPNALPLFTQRCPDVLKAGLLRQLLEQNNWLTFTFVLSRSALRAFPTEGRGPVSRPVLHRAMATCLAVRHQPEPQPEGGEPWAEPEPAGGDRFEVVFPGEVVRLRADTHLKALEWVEALREVAGSLGAASGDEGPPGEATEPALQGALLRRKPSRERRQREAQRAKRQSVTTSFLGILTHLAVEKGLTAQSFRCAGE